MNILLGLSLVVNAVLVAWAAWQIRCARDTHAWLARERRHAQEEIDAARQGAAVAHARYRALMDGVTLSIRRIGQDIDRNYQHTHEHDLLAELAHAMAVMPGYLRPALADRIRHAGGAPFMSGDELPLGGALQLAWLLHGEARRRAGELTLIVQECCGRTDHAAWLGKTLAMYERICDGDKRHAIDSLSRVLDVWRFRELDAAVSYHLPPSADGSAPDTPG